MRRLLSSRRERSQAAGRERTGQGSEVAMSSILVVNEISTEREELAPMTPFERKIVHDAVAAVPGVHSESEGAEPSRRVVVLLD